MAKMWTKADVFCEVAVLRQKCGITCLPVDAVKLAKEACPNLTIEILNFKTPLIGGILYRGENTTRIALNSLHKKQQQNACCAHELMHYFWHNDGDMVRMCSTTVNTNNFVEWQANEGASELLMPYRDFIPAFVQELLAPENYNQKLDFCYIPSKLGDKYKVTPTMAEFRINDLLYGTIQYLKGTNIEDISIISRTQQLRGGVNYRDFNAMANHFEEIKKLFMGEINPSSGQSCIAQSVDAAFSGRFKKESPKGRELT